MKYATEISIGIAVLAIIASVAVGEYWEHTERMAKIQIEARCK